MMAYILPQRVEYLLYSMACEHARAKRPLLTACRSIIMLSSIYVYLAPIATNVVTAVVNPCAELSQEYQDQIATHFECEICCKRDIQG